MAKPRRSKEKSPEISNAKEITAPNEAKLLEAIKGFLATKKY